MHTAAPLASPFLTPLALLTLCWAACCAHGIGRGGAVRGGGAAAAAVALPRRLQANADALGSTSSTSTSSGGGGGGTAAIAYGAHGAAHDLGVRSFQLYFIAPVNGTKKILYLRVWVKLVGPAVLHRQAVPAVVPYALPYQHNVSVHGFAWPEDFFDLDRANGSRLDSVLDPCAWQPKLRMETALGKDVESQSAWHAIQRSQHPRRHTFCSRARPFDFSFDLGAAWKGPPCFKVLEASKPGYKAPFCLPPLRSPLPPLHLCRRLAPDDISTPTAPALWTVLPPFRSIGVNGSDWPTHMATTAARLHNFDLHHEALGSAGVLLYADHFMRLGLSAQPLVQSLLARKRLLFVDWDMGERAPALMHNYDQNLVSSHALLGLSSCGTNLVASLHDADEFLYSEEGHKWPAMYECLRKSAADEHAALFRVPRITVLSSRVSPDAELALWRTPAASLQVHPLLSYDLAAAADASHPPDAKVLALPAADIAAFDVHDAIPLHGSHHEADPRCASLLHVVNLWEPRVHKGGADTSPRAFKLLYRPPEN